MCIPVLFLKYWKATRFNCINKFDIFSLLEKSNQWNGPLGTYLYIYLIYWIVQLFFYSSVVCLFVCLFGWLVCFVDWWWHGWVNVFVCFKRHFSIQIHAIYHRPFRCYSVKFLTLWWHSPSNSPRSSVLKCILNLYSHMARSLYFHRVMVNRHRMPAIRIV